MIPFSKSKPVLGVPTWGRPVDGDNPITRARSAATVYRRPPPAAAVLLAAALVGPSAVAQPSPPPAAPAPFAAALQPLERQAAPLRPTVADLRYQQVPWAADAAEALRQARAEGRPLFLWAAGGRGRDGSPLERC
jgi:hypothetical protein